MTDLQELQECEVYVWIGLYSVQGSLGQGHWQCHCQPELLGVSDYQIASKLTQTSDELDVSPKITWFSVGGQIGGQYALVSLKGQNCYTSPKA